MAETNIASLTEDHAVRTVFTIELKCDIGASDDERRKAFIDLAVMSAEQLYGTACMLADHNKPPVINLARTDREGKELLPLFGQDANQEL